MRKSAQCAVSVECYRDAAIDVPGYVIEKLLRQVRDADTIIIRVERFGPDDLDGAGALRSGPDEGSRGGVEAYQVPLPFGSDSEREREPGA